MITSIPSFLSYPVFVHSRFKAGHLLPNDPLSLMLNHAILAIPEELGELVEPGADLLEESGDLLFYVQAIINLFPSQQDYWQDSLFLGLDIKIKTKGFVHLHDVLIASSKLTNVIKQVTVYGKPIPPSWEKAIADRCIILAELVLFYIRQCDPTGSIDGKYDTFDQLMKANQAKLTKRHPVTYTDAQALEKADHVEGKVDWNSLETKVNANNWGANKLAVYTECPQCKLQYSNNYFTSCPTCSQPTA